MSRSLGGLVVVLVVSACLPAPIPAATSTAPTPSAESASFTVAGAGRACGPWWMGCGAFLTIQVPGWTLPVGWAPAAHDTEFAVQLSAGSERPARITGVRRLGQGEIEPGVHLLAVITTRHSDVSTPGTIDAAYLDCVARVTVPPETRSVAVDVTFGGKGSACSIAVTLDPPTSASP
jgi:hypothetical protein